MDKKLINFYKGTHPDDEGRYIWQIHQWDFKLLEDVHNYIQWLFPLSEKSSFNLNAPLLNTENIEAFKIDSVIRENVYNSLKMFLDFLGFEINYSDKLEIRQNQFFDERKKNWLSEKNHNFLRITRVLKCLMILNFQEFAMAFFECLKKVYFIEPEIISEKTFMFWTEAVEK